MNSQFVIQYQAKEDDDGWLDWSVFDELAEAEREWRMLQMIKPQRRLRLMEIRKAQIGVASA